MDSRTKRSSQPPPSPLSINTKEITAAKLAQLQKEIHKLQAENDDLHIALTQQWERVIANQEMKVRGQEATNLTLIGSINILWQTKSLRNLQRLMPRLILSFI